MAEEVKAEQPVHVPINMKYPADLKPVYSNFANIQQSDHDIVISFFQTVISAERVTPEAQSAFAETAAKNGVDTQCVARIIVAKSFYPGLVALLQNNVPRVDKDELKKMLTQLTQDVEAKE